MAENIVEKAARGMLMYYKYKFKLCNCYSAYLLVMFLNYLFFHYLDGLFNHFISGQDYKAKWTPISATYSSNIYYVSMTVTKKLSSF